MVSPAPFLAMRYGALTQRITIENFTTARDSAGGLVKTWTTYAQPYAHIKYEKGKESLEGARDTWTEKAVFVVQYDSDTKNMTSTMRISYNGYWDIESVRIMDRFGKIEIHAIRKDG